MEPPKRSKRAACTIIARNYLAHAKVLAESYFAHVADGQFFLFVVDGLPESVQLDLPVTVLEPASLRLTEFAEMAFKYDVTELCTAVKPALLAFILQNCDAQQVVYLDPDITIFRPLDEMWTLLSQSNIVLIPHLLDPIPLDGKRPSEQDILSSGAYNLGFIGLRDAPEVRRMLDWWAERLRDHCRIDVPNGLFVDQKWIDLVPSLFESTAILRDATYDVAYWNLHSRVLEHGPGGVLVDGRPLAFFHFSGFDPATPGILSKHQNRLTVGYGSPLAGLLNDYTHHVQLRGSATTRDWPYGYGTFDNGLAISRPHRDLYGALDPEMRQAFGDPFQTTSADSFFDWSVRSTNATTGLSPFLEQLLASSADARRAFPEALGSQRKAFLSWAQTYAAEGFGYDPRLADPSAWGGPVQGQGGVAASVGTNRTLGTGPEGVNVIGYLTNETGIGAVARGFVDALRGLDVPLGLTDLAALSPNRSSDTTLKGIDDSAPHRINLVCVNADQHFVVKAHVGADLFANHYNIAVWFWELPTFPAEWVDRFAEYDEIWAPSTFIASTLSPISPVPVVHMTPVLGTTELGSRELGRARLGVGPDTFVFLFIFDFASYFERKNPVATIEAFQRAFSPSEDVRLVIKCVNEQLDPDAFARMQSLIGEHPVSVHTGYWTSDEVRNLTAASDAYVSLHRSEGLGLTIADAMALGKPVIATAWSGNTDFMTAANSFPVSYELVAIDRDAGPYRAGAVWAEPSIDEASQLMRLVFDDRDLARARGQIARRNIATEYSVRHVGERMQPRLAVAKERLKVGGSTLAPKAASAASPLSAPTVPPMDLRGSSHGRVGALIKRAVNFLLRYHSYYQSEINLAFANFMRQLLAEQEAQRTQVARLNGYFGTRPYMASDAYGSNGDLRQPMGFGQVDGASAASTPTPEFADLFRGPTDFIAARQRVYLSLLKGKSEIVDLGSGRGEFLDLCREQGLAAIGVELDEVLVERCKRRGLRVEHADAFEYLEGLPKGSIDAIFSAQFVEHIESQRLAELVELAYSRLRDSGVFIAETVNPESYLALKTFFIDLSHQRPIYPQVLLHICQTAGFKSGRVFYPTGGGFTQTAYADAGEYAVVVVK